MFHFYSATTREKANMISTRFVRSDMKTVHRKCALVWWCFPTTVKVIMSGMYRLSENILFFRIRLNNANVVAECLLEVESNLRSYWLCCTYGNDPWQQSNPMEEKSNEHTCNSYRKRWHYISIPLDCSVFKDYFRSNFDYRVSMSVRWARSERRFRVPTRYQTTSLNYAAIPQYSHDIATI